MTPCPRLSPDRVLSCDDADDNDNNDSNIEKSRDLELIGTIRRKGRVMRDGEGKEISAVEITSCSMVFLDSI